MKKKLVAIISVVAMLVTMFPATVFAEVMQDCPDGDNCDDHVCAIGTTHYGSLQAAVNSITDDEETKIKLLNDSSGDGVKVKEGSNIIFDLNNHTYDIKGNLVGSTGTETNGFQLLKNSNVTFKNGIIKSDKAKILIQNYANLTLENVILESESADYVLSNNYGKTNLTGKTSIYAGEGKYAFDAFYWPNNGYKEPPKITVNTTGVIEGKIEIKDDETRAGENLNKSASVTIENGTINKPINVGDKLGCLTINGGKINEITAVGDAENILITGGEFKPSELKSLEKYIPSGMKIENGKIVAKADAEAKVGTAVYAELEQAVAAAKAGDIITLMKDVEVDNEINIDDANVIFDGNNHSITSNVTTSTGYGCAILINGADNVTVRNVTVNAKAAKHGVQFYKSENGTISGVTVNGATWTSVLVNGSSVSMRDCKLNPAADSYATIEYAMGSEVTTVPKITMNNVTTNGKFIIWADKATLDRVKYSLVAGATQDEAIDKIHNSITADNNVEFTISIGLQAGDNPLTSDENIPSTKPSTGGGTVTPSVTKSRVAGDDRFETAIKVADKLKSELGVVKFNNIVVAYSDEFADALSATALAADKDAPILVVNKNNESTVKTYIANNLNKGGNVYIIGGTAVVSESFEKSLTDCKVTRLGGSDRYETNLEVLKTLGVTGASDIMIASGLKYPDALSASATGNPVLLVGKTLTDNQKAYLATLGGNDDYYVIGGTAAVNATVMNQLNASKLGTVTRLGGDTRYETGLAVADEFFTNARNVVIASGDDFPDGLTGGVLANAMNAPLMLVNQYNTDVAADYVDDNSVRSVVAIGGTAAISNAVLNAVA